jgi:hypothetical protein
MQQFVVVFEIHREQNHTHWHSWQAEQTKDIIGGQEELMH